jgi:DNA polymerase-3 subunit epsilon
MNAQLIWKLEQAAALLAAHPNYRVLRALPRPDQFLLAEPHATMRIAAIVDTETLGLGSDDPIIDLAVQRIAFDERGRIVRLGRMRQWFEDPGVPIPPAISALTGISDADVAGQRIDEHEATGIIAGCDVIIAHNAAFDAPRIEQRLPMTAGHAWACSCHEISWPEHGLDGRKLGHLLMQLGLFHQGHRAAADVWATVNLLAQPLPGGDTGLLELVTRAGQPTLKIEACDAPFAAKDALKARGYRWHVVRRIWWSEIATEDEAAERQWLAQVCQCREPRIATVTWCERHR